MEDRAEPIQMSRSKLLIVLRRQGFAGFEGFFLMEPKSKIQNSLPLKATSQTPQTPDDRYGRTKLKQFIHGRGARLSRLITGGLGVLPGHAAGLAVSPLLTRRRYQV
jgi:hypothetical protein